MIEHRCSLRCPVEAEVILNCRAVGLIRGVARDLGVDGLFVDLGCVQLPLNALVEVTLLLNDGGSEQTVKADAMVVHQAGDGVGLMFRDLDPRCHMVLHDIVYTGDRHQQARVMRHVSIG